MAEKYQLIAYCATLTALVAVVLGAFIASGLGVTATEAFGLGAVTGGLIGVLPMPTRTVGPATSIDRADNVQREPQ